MEPFQNIQLSFKCPKAFDELQPCDNNWYCDGCQKMVYDFRGMTEEQILEAFAKSGQKLCGIYEADRIRVLPQQPKWLRWVMAAVTALSVTILNSCGFGQRDRTIVTSGVLLPPPPAHDTTMGKSLKTDTAKITQKTKRVNVKFPPPVLMGDVQVVPNRINISMGIADPGVKKDTTVDMVFGGTDVQPTFPGGVEVWQKYVYEHIKYNGEYQGRVYVQFTVEIDGTQTDVKIMRGGDKVLNDQLISIVQNAPYWRPGTQNGKPVRQQYTVPFNFTLQDK